jgi:membrane protease subunit HflK
MENVYRNSRKVITDTKNGSNLMYLPLDKLISIAPQAITNPNDTMTVAPARLPDAPAPSPEDPARARGVR